MNNGKVETVKRFTFEDNYNRFRKTMLYPCSENKIVKVVKKINYSDVQYYIQRKVVFSH